VDHLLLPLDPPHARAVDLLADAVAAAVGFDPGHRPSPHITLLAFDGVPRDRAEELVRPILARTEPFEVHAHGYGLFTGTRPKDLSIHVPVARCTALDDLHRRAYTALHDAGARIEGAGLPVTWLPHVTVVDHGLDACSLALALAWLAGRGHPRWHVPIDRVVLTGGRTEPGGPHLVIPFGEEPIHAGP
jgi:2'-5' RNA ligase